MVVVVAVVAGARVGEGLERSDPLTLNRRRDIVRKLSGARPRPRRVGKDVNVGELRLPTQCHRLAEVVRRFAGKAGDHVAGDRGTRYCRSDGLQRPEESRAIVAASHPPQHRVATTLQREVEVAAQAAVLPLLQELTADVLRLDGGVADVG